MRTPTRVALRPNNEAPRRSWGAERGTVDYISSSADKNNTRQLQTQWLQRFGLVGLRADLVAALHFGEAA